MSGRGGAGAGAGSSEEATLPSESPPAWPGGGWEQRERLVSSRPPLLGSAQDGLQADPAAHGPGCRALPAQHVSQNSAV